MRPRIGITTSTLDRAPEGAIQLSAATHLAYARCIQQAGGLPFLLPNVPGADAYSAAMLATLDGLLLSGGGDLDPALWQEDPLPELGLVDTVRDTVEIALTHEALRRDLPVLGICRGVQVLTIATGGDLWQDLPSQRPAGLCHRQTCPRQQPCHEVDILPGSLLAQICWPEGSDRYTLPVNSFHHQAPRNYGTLCAAIGKSPDGLIEALVVPDAQFALGVQWHPEDMAETDPRHARIFTAFIAAAAGRPHPGQ
jgi:putative glutamine amidotransferase